MKKIIFSCFTFLRSFTIVLLFLALGKLFIHYSGLPFPGSIIGLLLLFTALSLRLIDYRLLMPATDFLLSYMTLFFVPAGVGLLQYGDLLSQYWLTILLSSVISTFAVIISVGWCYQRLAK